MGLDGDGDSLGVSCINGVSSKTSLLEAVPALSASPVGDNGRTEGLRLGESQSMGLGLGCALRGTPWPDEAWRRGAG